MARNQVCLKYNQLDEDLLEGEREVSPPTPTALASALANGKAHLRVRTKKILTPLSSLWSENLKTVDISYDLIIRTRCFAEEQPQQKYRSQGQHLHRKNSVQEIYFSKQIFIKYIVNATSVFSSLALKAFFRKTYHYIPFIDE